MRAAPPMLMLSWSGSHYQYNALRQNNRRTLLRPFNAFPISNVCRAAIAYLVVSVNAFIGRYPAGRKSLDDKASRITYSLANLSVVTMRAIMQIESPSIVSGASKT